MKYKTFFLIWLSTISLLIASTAILIFQLQNTMIKIPSIITNDDMDNDGVTDIEDILMWAKKEIKNKTSYHSEYYAWWYPPESEWVCSDVIWRALKHMWYDMSYRYSICFCTGAWTHLLNCVLCSIF